MARTQNPPIHKQPEFSTRSMSLTSDVLTVLQRLSSDASDFLGRPISSSAIVRALVRQIDHQGPSAADALFLVVEKEMKGGRIWGKKK